MKCKKCRAFSADFHARGVRKRPDKGRNPGRFNFPAVARVCIGVIGRLFGASGFALVLSADLPILVAVAGLKPVCRPPG